MAFFGPFRKGWATGWTAQGSNPGRPRDLCFSITSILALEPDSTDTRIRGLEHEVHNFPLSSSEVKNERNCTSSPTIHRYIQNIPD
jgi:hypothetical protein